MARQIYAAPKRPIGGGGSLTEQTAREAGVFGCAKQPNPDGETTARGASSESPGVRPATAAAIGAELLANQVVQEDSPGAA